MGQGCKSTPSPTCIPITNNNQRGQLDEDELEDVFVLERDCPEVTPEGLFPAAPAAQFTSLPGDLEEQLKEFLKAVRAVDPGLVPDKRKRDELQLAIVARALQTLEAGYPTTLAQDEQILASDAPLGDRERMALVVRVGEKRLLREARAFLEEVSRREQEGGSASPVKKARIE